MDEFISGYIRSAREEYARYQGSPPPLWAHEPSPIRPSMDRQWCVSQRRRAPLCNLRRQPDVTRRDPPSSSPPSKNHPPPSKERKKKKEERIKILGKPIHLIYIDRTKRLSCYYIYEISNISFEQHHENFVKICSDQRLFNVKETTQRVTLTVRGEDRDSYSRGARIQLDGSTDVNGERERERYNGETFALELIVVSITGTGAFLFGR